MDEKSAFAHCRVAWGFPAPRIFLSLPMSYHTQF